MILKCAKCGKPYWTLGRLKAHIKKCRTVEERGAIYPTVDGRFVIYFDGDPVSYHSRRRLAEKRFRAIKWTLKKLKL